MAAKPKAVKLQHYVILEIPAPVVVVSWALHMGGYNCYKAASEFYAVIRFPPLLATVSAEALPQPLPGSRDHLFHRCDDAVQVSAS